MVTGTGGSYSQEAARDDAGTQIVTHLSSVQSAPPAHGVVPCSVRGGLPSLRTQFRNPTSSPEPFPAAFLNVVKLTVKIALHSVLG